MKCNNMMTTASMIAEEAGLRDSFRGIIDEAQQTAFNSFASLDDNEIEECFGLDVATAASVEVAEPESSPAMMVVTEPWKRTTPIYHIPLPPVVTNTSNNEQDADTKPKRPLSAYNLFFQLERERLIAGSTDTSFTADDVERVAIARRIAQMQTEQPKRKHRKSHGKITFAELARTIANNWKILKPFAKDMLQERAAIEKARYLRELEEWTKKSEWQKKELSQSSSQIQVPFVGSQFVEPSVVVNPQQSNEGVPNPSLVHMTSMSSMSAHNQSTWHQENFVENHAHQDSLNHQGWAAENEMHIYQKANNASMRIEHSFHDMRESPKRVRLASMSSVQNPIITDNRSEYSLAASDVADVYSMAARTGVDPSKIMMIFQQMEVQDGHPGDNMYSVPPSQSFPSAAQPVAMQQYRTQRQPVSCLPHHRRQQRPDSNTNQLNDIVFAQDNSYECQQSISSEEERQMSMLLASYEEDCKRLGGGRSFQGSL